jgi:hypothetical protein
MSAERQKILVSELLTDPDGFGGVVVGSRQIAACQAAFNAWKENISLLDAIISEFIHKTLGPHKPAATPSVVAAKHKRKPDPERRSSCLEWLGSRTKGSESSFEQFQESALPTDHVRGSCERFQGVTVELVARVETGH